jgi:hypothetical protein
MMDRISLTNGQIMNLTIRKNNSKRIAESLLLMPIYKVVSSNLLLLRKLWPSIHLAPRLPDQDLKKL